MKSKGVAYLLWCAGFIGLCGLHRFYIGKVGTGLLWLFTLGLLGVGQLVDLFILGGQVDVANLKKGVGHGVSNSNENRNHQNVIVNVSAPTSAPPATDLAAARGQQNVPAVLNPTDELERLVMLLEKGHLTQEEFTARKAKLLAS